MYEIDMMKWAVIGFVSFITVAGGIIFIYPLAQYIRGAKDED